jgi:hypothetical protein
VTCEEWLERSAETVVHPCVASRVQVVTVSSAFLARRAFLAKSLLTGSRAYPGRRIWLPALYLQV